MTASACPIGIALALSITLISPKPAQSQIYDLRELSADQIGALDREHTVVLMSANILEEHGPYLPSYTDGYVNEFLVDAIARAVTARPGWSVLVFPPIPLGAGGANQVGFRHVYPGTYHVHFRTLRAVFMDLAAELGDGGFKWIFVVARHGNASHIRALDQASEFFNDSYQGTMVHLDGLVPPNRRPVQLQLTQQELAENGFDPHAGLSETSRVLFLRRDLVKPEYSTAKPFTGKNWSDLVAMARADGWRGYFGSPRLATAARGAAILEEFSRQYVDLTLRVLDGLDPRSLQRTLETGALSAGADPGRVEYLRESDRHDAEIESRKAAWLTRKGY